MAGHTITRSLVQGMRIATLRARCSCEQFVSDVPRLSTPGRRKQDRLIREHLAGTCDPTIAEALVQASVIEAPL